MTSLTKLKLGLTIIGLILFAYGVRMDQGMLRAIAIGFVAAASLLRFVKTAPRDARRDDPPAEP